MRYRQLYRALRTVDAPLVQLLLLSVLGWWSVEVISGTHAHAPWILSLCEFTKILCAAYFGSFIFYFFTVQIKEQRYKEIIDSYVQRIGPHIVSSWRGFIHKMFPHRKDLQDQLMRTSDVKEFERIFHGVAAVPSAHPGKNPMEAIEWAEILKGRKEQTMERINTLLVHRLDPELLDILIEILTHEFQYDVALMQNRHLSQDLSLYAQSMSSYGMAIKRLSDYLGIDERRH